MKNSIVVLILGVALVGVSLAQTPTNKSNRVTVAVIEFTPGPKASGMTAEAKRQLQASFAFALAETGRFDVEDVRNTRYATKADLEAINGASTAPAVRAGKKLGVSYVLTGNVVEYNTEGHATLNIRLVEVATGKVRHAEEKTQQSTSPMLSDGAREMMTRVLRPMIEDLTANLLAEKL